jgi:hypothetical protein
MLARMFMAVPYTDRRIVSSKRPWDNGTANVIWPFADLFGFGTA